VTTAIQLSQIELVYRRYPHAYDALLEWVLRAERHEKFYALQKVNFQLQQGDSLGIIGDNGAGKSTLLRLLAGNLRPTQGDLVVRGRRSARRCVGWISVRLSANYPACWTLQSWVILLSSR